MKPCLYPIGTQLITRRLSQAALAYEFGFKLEVPVAGFYLFEEKYDEWRITVTAENQKWLSPVPMVGDSAVDYYNSYGEVTDIRLVGPDKVIAINIEPVESPQFEQCWAAFELITKRTYPNGQRAPLLEWDEVILPQQGASS